MVKTKEKPTVYKCACGKERPKPPKLPWRWVCSGCGAEITVANPKTGEYIIK